MLTRIEAVSPQGSLLNLPLEDLYTGLLTTKVEGTGPVKATLTSSSFAQLDGSEYQSSRREERNINMRIDYEPDWTVETVDDLREKVEKHFMPKAPIELRFYSDSKPPRIIKGRIETCEDDRFVENPGADISIICNDPDFIDTVPVVVGGQSTETTDGEIVEYEGSVETGFLFTLFVDRDFNEFTIYHTDPSGLQQQLDFAGELLIGDELTIQTTPGAKFARLLRGGVTTSFLYGVSPQSSWLKLYPGDNVIRVFALGDPITYSLTYTRKYGGL